MPRVRRGFSLIELLITVAIVSVLLALALPSYRIWISNMRIRTAAESIQNGLQLARGEAVRRNSQISFQLTSSIDNTCGISAPNTDVGSSWVVSFTTSTASLPNACGAPPLNEAFAVTDLINNPQPQIIQTRSADESAQTVVVNAGQTAFAFNGLGRLAAPPATNPVVISVSNPTAGTCVLAGGDVRCLNVTVTLGGQIRMCDPAIVAANDPRLCTAAG